MRQLMRQNLFRKYFDNVWLYVSMNDLTVAITYNKLNFAFGGINTSLVLKRWET